jgi:hypothetical protein
MLDSDDESAAREALRRASLTHESYSREFEQMLVEADPPTSAVQPEEGDIA